MNRHAVEIPRIHGRPLRRRPRWVPLLFYLGLLLFNLVLMLFFSAGAWNGTFLDLYSRIVPSPDPEMIGEPHLEQYPPGENWTGEEQGQVRVKPIARSGPPVK